MKKTIIAMLVFAFVAFGVFIVFGLNPPTPTVKAEGKEIAVGQGSYCWNRIIHTRCVDMIAPQDLITHYELKQVKVSPGAVINIDFLFNPKAGTLSVTQWNPDGESIVVPVNGDKITLPKEAGTYIYDLSATWSRGSSSYVFVVEVR
ncbi:hypothetical protein FIU87_02770 [Bacillus sp. THAF10]|uniref:hypothetical protein n=1 Tax=Bacillus sp. THAF10 TaxID=2587848 RepID=UPI0012680212|nr:hypothetical protein [Bacillus sp. THAF10]QFT87564.1 hypothetical protein FIU87_02770 [Bacillus sp. THAF10]